MDRSDKPVVAIGLADKDGMVAAQRAASVNSNVVVVAEAGAVTPPGATTVETPPGKARIGRAVREAAARDSWWVVVPASLGGPEYLLGSAVRSVAKVVDVEHPGVALLTCAPGTRWPYQRILVVVDPLGSTASGFAAWVTVALAERTGAHVDVLAVGVPPGAPMASREARQSYIPVARRTDLLRLALDRMDEFGIAPTWIAGGFGLSAVEALRTALANGAYDVVVDDLGGARIRKRVGKRRSVRRLLADDGGGAVPLWAMGNSGCDVLTVIDGVALGMLPAGVLRTGAVAAMTVGMLGAAAPAMAAPSSSATAPAVTASAQPGDVETSSHDQSHADVADTQSPEAAADVAEQLATAHDWVHSLGEDVSVDEHAVAMAALDDAQKQASKATKQVDEHTAVLDQAEADVAKAHRQVDKAEAGAEPSADGVAAARNDLAAARADLAVAQDEHEALARNASGLSGLLRFSATPDDVAAAEASVAAAEEALAHAHAVEAERYAEYQQFAPEVDEAQAALAQANDDMSKAEAELALAAAEAEAAHELATGYESLAAEVHDAFRAQGLVAPATGGVTSDYGNRVHPVTGEHKLHTGTDFAATDGNYYAAMDGTVSYAAYDSAYGYMVKIDHGEIDGHHVETWYAHQPELQVSLGQEVSAGDKLGDIGSTGYSTGPHAHFELRVDGNPIDPVPYIR
ncbi:MAG: M23 family metallopeptidase [Jiangellales bacterium]